MKKAALLLALAFLFHTPLHARAATQVSAEGCILIEAESGKVLYEKNADAPLPMASTTKIMTALIVLETMPLDHCFAIPEEAVGIEGTSLYLTEGERHSVSDLLYALLLRSANDAAVALACEACGSVEEFALRMNEKATKLGLTGTQFDNPHGLDSPTHYTTARDLAILAAEAMQNPHFAKIVSCPRKRLAPQEGVVRTVINHNKLLRLYGDALGVKTGFTKKSGRCLVGAAEMEGALFITVTLNAPDDWQDHIRLFEYGRTQLARRMLYESGEYIAHIPMVGGAKDSVAITNFSALTPIEQKGAEGTLAAEYNHFATAPVKKGQVLGSLTYTAKDGTVTEVELCAAEHVPSRREGGWFARLFSKFSK